MSDAAPGEALVREPWSAGSFARFVLDASGGFHLLRFDGPEDPVIHASMEYLGFVGWKVRGLVGPDGGMVPTGCRDGVDLWRVLRAAADQYEHLGIRLLCYS